MRILEIKRLLLYIAALIMSLSVLAHEVEFSYNGMQSVPYGYGFKKNQKYDIGIYLNFEAVNGRKIKSIAVKVFDEDKISSATGWISKTLNVSKDNESIFTPDIAVYNATIEEGEIRCGFPDPVEVPEDGIYVGYTLAVEGLSPDQTALPVSVVEGSTPGGLWFHSTQTQKRWVDLATRDNLLSAMVITLEGDFLSDAATISFTRDKILLAEDETGEVETILTNWGVNGISSIDYTYTIGDVSVSHTYELPTTLSPMLGKQTYLKIPVEPLAERGEYNYDLRITKVNNSVNQISESTISSPLTIQAFVPVYRPLVEEYTGLTCGWCPRGYVMLEQMKHAHGDKFVALSYHSSSQENGAMCCIPPSDFPANILSYPAATIDRGTVMDPNDIPNLWNANHTDTTIADVHVDIEWKDESESTLVIKSKARFLEDINDSEYLFSIALLADNLSNNKWVQSNAYSDYQAEGEYLGQFWDLFIGKSNHILGLIYNDIVVHYTDIYGIEGSLPTNIEAEKWYEYQFEIETGRLVNLSGEQFINDLNKIRAVAMIVKKSTGKPINCISSIYPDHTTPSNITALDNDIEVMKRLYYDLQGRETANPGKGIWILYEEMSDSSIKVSKIRH